MGSKTPEGHGQGPDGSSSNTAINRANPPKSAAASGLVHGALEGQDEDGDDDDEQVRFDLNGSGANGTK
ncbi:hypothetical protein HBH61_136670 [Parastagonospora nodorum]|nr:hypothetical protein HBH61_136670 [Parastagonospora nodorum]